MSLESPRRAAVLHSMRRAVRWTARAAAIGLAAVFSMLLLAGTVLHWVILPHIDDWRPLLERRARQALGVPVRIGAIVVRSGAWVPAVELRDVALHDAEGRPALVLPRVVATVGARSLLVSIARLEPRLDQLVIDGAELEVRRDAAGRVFVAGIGIGGDDGAAGDDDAAADWLLRQREVAVRGATLRWTDERRDAAPLALQAVDIVLRNGVRRHAVRLDATPPAAWGERFTLRGIFNGGLLARPSEWRRWSGSAYAELPRADARELRRHVDLPFELTQGRGALRAWLEMRDGRFESLTADLALRDVALRFASAEPLAVARLGGRVAASERDGRGAFALQQFGLVTGDGASWPAGDLRATWTRDASDGAVGGGSFKAERLDLAAMAQTASRLPLGGALRRLIAELRPRGVVSGVRVEWDGPLDAPRRWRVQASARGLSLDAQPAADGLSLGRPGLRNADVSTFSATEQGGEARLAMQGGGLDFPGVFAAPAVPVTSLQARLQWRVEPRQGSGAPPAVSVQVKDATLVNADARIAFAGAWQGRPGTLGRLHLDGTLRDARATSIARYLPLGIPDGPRRYVERAIRAGSVKQATFRVDGDLADFPLFAPKTPGGPPSGQFRIASRLEDVTLAYAPADGGETPWPIATQAGGELVFDRASMGVSDVRGTIAGLKLDGVHGGIDDLTARPVLALEGRAAGALAAMLRFVDASPIGDWIDGALRPATATGDAKLELALAVPLDDLARSGVRGSLRLAGNDVRLRPGLPLLENARGRVDFTEKSLRLDGVAAQALGGAATLGGGLHDGALRLTAQGIATAEALRRAAEPGLPARLAAALSGQAGYRLALGFVAGVPELELTSDLSGLGIALPAPLAKPPQAALPLRVAMQPTRPAAGGVVRDALQVDLGTLAQARYEREWSGGAPRVLRGAVGIGAREALPATGVVSARVTLASLDADAWLALASGGGTAGQGAGGADAAAYAPTRVTLKTDALDAGGRRLTRVDADARWSEGAWLADITADQLAGHVEYRPNRIAARLARLSLPKGDAGAAGAAQPDRPLSDLPALDVSIDELTIGGRQLGSVKVEAADSEREWKLSNLSVALPGAELSASGNWSKAAPQRGGRRTRLDFRLELTDAGALLGRLGMPNAVAGGKGQVRGSLAWQGSPLSPEAAGMSGRFTLAVEAGRLLKAEAGAARLLSVLSLQSLRRRLALDFRDFDEGFVFDSFTGDVTIEGGKASSNNLRMRGLQAAVLMEGTADLARETQDLNVVVVPEINAGTASLAYAVINPAIGLGTFFAQWLLRQPLREAGTREFHVSGSWDDPKVERVERKPAQDATTVPATASATSAPSAANIGPAAGARMLGRLKSLFGGAAPAESR